MSQHPRICPACGASLSSGSVDCEYCGSRVVPLALSFREREEGYALVKQLNAHLASQENRLRRWVEGLTLLVLAVGLAILLGLWLWFGIVRRGWILMVVFSLLCLIFRSFLLRRWASSRFITVFRLEIEPQIGAFTREKGLPRWQFDQMASSVLDEHAPLQQFLNAKSD